MGADLFGGFFQQATDKTITQYQIGLCPLIGIKSFYLANRISIGLETGPRFGKVIRHHDVISQQWENKAIDNFFLYFSCHI